MEGLVVTVKPYPENQPYDDAIEALAPLIAAIEAKLDFGKKTALRSIQVKNTLDITCHFLKQGNLKAAQLTLMKHGDGLFVKDIYKIFYNNKKEKKRVLELTVAFLEEMEKISKN